MLADITNRLNKKSLNYIQRKHYHASTTPPRSQVEELQMKSILFNHKNYMLPPARKHNRRVTFSSRYRIPRRTAATERYKPKWKPWSEFRPNQDGQENFSGNYRGESEARKYTGRKQRRATATAEKSAENATIDIAAAATGRVYCDFENKGSTKPKSKLSRAQPKATATAYVGAGYGAKQVPPKLSAAQLRAATIAGEIPTIVVDSGASSS